MKAILVAVASAMAIAPALTSGASAAPVANGSWSFVDYTPDPSSLAADDALHTVAGATITSYCHGSRVPTAPQDVNVHAFRVTKPSLLQLHIAATGAWGLDVNRSRGRSLAGITTTRASGGTDLSVRLRPGLYVVQACNLGGAPTAQVGYRLR